MINLRNSQYTMDIRLDRIKQFDERSRRYAIGDLIGVKPLRSYTWRCLTVLDQGAEGSCVGHGCAHELIARPSEVPVDHKYAREKIYWAAQKIDEWPGGAYPGARPVYEGTSVLAGLKVLRSLGWCDAYRWSFSLEELALGVGYNGPAIIGIDWYDGMMEVDKKGFIHPTGSLSGGHCILCNAVNVKAKRFTLHNSWGPAWGIGGECYISFQDMDFLIHQQGESAFLTGRHFAIV